MLPKAIPALTDEQWKQLEEEIKREPSPDDLVLLRRAREMFKK